MGSEIQATRRVSWFVSVFRFFTAPLVNLYYAALMPVYVLRVLRGDGKK